MPTPLDSPSTTPDPHASQPVRTAGPPPKDAAATLVLVHGRGGTAEDILSVYRELRIHDGIDRIAALAPQAAGQTWYPHSFLSPIESNQPWLDSALRKLASLVDDLLARGIPAERIALLGFSQGACLTSEFVARHPRRYGAVMALTGGLIGPQGTPRDYPGSLAQTPIFLGCGDPDPHIPFARVLETESVFTRMGATVEVRRYPGRPHTISGDELAVCRAMLRRLIS
jgi:predicted esterase